MSNSLNYPKKDWYQSTYQSAKPFISSFRPQLSHKKMYSAKRTREKKRYTLTEPCYYSLSRSRSFRNCRVALLLCQFVMELIVFLCLFWLVLFLILSSAFILFILILICMHARFFFFEERLVIHPAIHSLVVHSLYHLPAFLSNLQTGHE